MDVFRAECANTNYDVRFVSETWFNDQSIVNIDGYKCFRRDRKSDTQGGGVCIYTQSSDYISYSDTNYDELNSSSIEQVWCVADTGLELILIGCIYRAKLIQERGVTASISEHKRRDDEINKVIRFANKLVKKGIFQGVY